MSDSYVPPIPDQAPKKKSSWLMWGLLGCGGLILIIAIVLIAGGLWVWNKVPKTEGAMIAKVIEMANPDVEVVKLDETAGVVTVRDKKTGKVTTLSLEDAKNGRISGTSDGKTESMTFGGAEGSTQNLPAWLPAYPGAKAGGGLTTEAEGKTGGTVSFTTSDSVADVVAFYKGKFEAEGLRLTSNEGQTMETADMAVLEARSDDESRTVTVSVARSEGQTTIVLTFADQKK